MENSDNKNNPHRGLNKHIISLGGTFCFPVFHCGVLSDLPCLIEFKKTFLIHSSFKLILNYGVVSKVTDTTSFSFNTSSSIVIAHF